MMETNTKNKVMILGSGDFAADVADVIDDIPNLELVGFVVNRQPYAAGASYLTLPIYWVDSLVEDGQTVQFICGISAAARKNFVRQVQRMGFSFAKVIHPTARVSRRAAVGAGTFINSGVQIATHCQIGRHVIINRGALIGHHALIDDYAVILPGANIASNCVVGQGTVIGMEAMLVEGRTVGKNAFVGAGSLVTKDVPDGVKVVGSPARIVARDKDWDQSP